MEKNKDIVFLFDVDGTLSPSRETASAETLHMLRELKRRVNIAFVGGSDLPKQVEQIGPDCLEIFDWGFPENGVQFYRGPVLEHSDSFIKFVGEDGYKALVNKVLALLAAVECPVKRGVFVELRASMLNVSPIGRSCSREERQAFFALDQKEHIRARFCADLTPVLEKLRLQAVIGGQISIDIFPIGWDKTYCLRHIKANTIVFFGDMTEKGGNDYEIYNHPKIRGVRVFGPEDTIKKVDEVLKDLGIPQIATNN